MFFVSLATLALTVSAQASTIHCRGDEWSLQLTHDKTHVKLDELVSLKGVMAEGTTGISRANTFFDDLKAKVRRSKDGTANIYAISAHLRKRDGLNEEQYTDVKLEGELLLNLADPASSSLSVVERYCDGAEHHAFTCSSHPFDGRDAVSRGEDVVCKVVP